MPRIKRLIVICLIFVSGIGFAAENRSSRAEQVMRALQIAHPGRISALSFRNNDWAVLLDGTWFYYANGRLLPERFLYRVSQYRHFPIYYYPRELPSLAERTPEQIDNMLNFANTRAAQLPRPYYFFNALFRAHDRAESYNQQTTVRFLGHSVRVHHAVTPSLALVENRINERAATDASVRAWINNIDRLYGWVWRTIGGTQSRSFHSYGLAIDIMPRSTGGRAVYWRWAGPNWWNLPYERRYHPPDAVIQAFESFGFIWGGKWSIFDTIHFEYRPELLLFNNFLLENRR